ncbi:expressed unknown protein [Seminavis robusta]|uniref:PHD-type domain-containing protein n=1 Tax=Seminavis robusta TaxID=568900 RepID=A0A9N8E8L7_9STRA|nr:expressed unknown protein [Seminavis robusta]|eukprot:Sro666_g184040.1 n/a (867) ;mRNA; r:38798-41680
MSSKKHLGPEETVPSEGGAKVGNAQAPGLSDNDKDPPKPSDEGNGKSAEKGSAESSKPEGGPDPSAAQRGPSDAASVTSNASKAEVPSRATRATRSAAQSKNGGEHPNGKKRDQEQESSESLDGDDEQCAFIDALASTLARVDEGAYTKAVFEDANSILGRIVFPMSFPWGHNIDPVVRNIPRDIDEMPGVISMDDPDRQVCSLKQGNFDLPKDEMDYEESDDDDDEDCIRAVARRADDPGVIELKTCAPCLESHERSALSAAIRTGCKPSILLRDPLIEPAPGSGSGSSKVQASNVSKVMLPDKVDAFDSFQQIQAEKRRKLENGMARLKTVFLSVKVESASTRPVIFQRDQPRVPLLLPAAYPQDFRPITKGKNAARSPPPGRSQLVWMEKTPSRTSHRVVYKSFITSERVESGTQKRPRDVFVGIRVNGKLLSSASITADDIVQDATAAAITSKRKRNDGKPTTLYSSKVVNDALDDACSRKTVPPSRQCNIEPEQFMNRVLLGELNKEKSVGWNTKVTIKSLNFIHIEPRIDCLPSEDGLFRVMCTAPGELPSAKVGDVLNQASKDAEYPVCTVCWRETSILGRDTCASCSIGGTPLPNSPASQQESSGTTQSERSFRRSSRSKESGPAKDAQKPVSCALCAHTGGAMSMLKRERRNIWVHDVCRMWSDLATEQPKQENGSKSPKKKTETADADGDDVVICALCGQADDSGEHNGIVRCAASGCSIHFHPMCALFLSKCAEIGAKENSKLPNGADPGTKPAPDSDSEDKPKGVEDPVLEKLLEDDRFLCRQYSLRFAKCMIPGRRVVRPSSIQSSPSTAAVLPVCFCGIHNPKRDRSLYGLYPGGQLMDAQVMRIPPRKTFE